jgi:hypothetical protein
MHPVKNSMNLCQWAASRGHCQERACLWSAQRVVRDFAHNSGAKYGCIHRRAQAFQKPHDCIAHPRVESSGADATIHVGRLLHSSDVHFDSQFADEAGFHTDRHPQQGLVVSRQCLALKRKRNRQHQVIVFVPGDAVGADVPFLVAACQDADARLIQNRVAWKVACGPSQVHTVHYGGMQPLSRRQLVQQGLHFALVSLQ